MRTLKASQAQIAALILSFPVGIYGTRALDRLYGPDRKQCRRVVMEGLTGQKQTIAACGIGKVADALYSAFGITSWSCLADKEKQLDAAVRYVARVAELELEGLTTSDAQAVADAESLKVAA